VPDSNRATIRGLNARPLSTRAGQRSFRRRPYYALACWSGSYQHTSKAAHTERSILPPRDPGLLVRWSEGQQLFGSLGCAGWPAPTIPLAILAHGGEALASRDAFKNLGLEQQASLQVFLLSLSRTPSPRIAR
jgi:hypothetical protein